MGNLTYRTLLETLQKMPEDRLDDNVSVYIPFMAEFYPVQCTEIACNKNMVLDEGHYFLKLDDE